MDEAHCHMRDHEDALDSDTSFLHTGVYCWAALFKYVSYELHGVNNNYSSSVSVCVSVLFFHFTVSPGSAPGTVWDHSVESMSLRLSKPTIRAE